ncbi:MAG: DNA polymerase domain-containing protein [Candidatus Bruticola sp.]
MEADQINISLADILADGNCPELCGAHPRLRVVCVVALGSEAYIWQRRCLDDPLYKSEPVTVTVEPFRPYLWLRYTDLNEVLKFSQLGSYESVKLTGSGFFNSIVSADSFEELNALNKEIKQNCGSSAHIFNSDLTNLYLTRAGFCLFSGLPFKEAVRLGITVCAVDEGCENLRRFTESPVSSISLRLSGGLEKNFNLSDYDQNEAELLRNFVAAVKSWDPDIIEGHGLYDDLLPYLQARAKKCRVKLLLGREFRADKSKSVSKKLPKGVYEEPKGRKTYTTIAGKRYDYTYWELWGRELVDTLMLARLRDVTFRELETFSLEETAQSLGVMSEENLSFASEAEQTVFWGKILERVSDTLLYPFYLQTQFFPYSLQNTILRGTATKINSLFLRHYLNCSVSIPDKPTVREYAGAAAGQEVEGIVHNVFHCDVQSLYPSLMLSDKLGPQTDELGLFLNLLAKLRNFRLQAKKLMRLEKDKEEIDVERVRFYDALQSTFKILINSFYGYLGFSQGNFADFERAARVTGRGREILSGIIAKLKELGCRVIEYDTDGVYFQASQEVEGNSEDYRRRLAGLINETLPDGVNVELDGFYPSMYSHTTKNYVLLDEKGELSFSGATFRSRSREPYLRLALQRIAGLVLQGREGEAADYIVNLKDKIRHHELPVSMLGKTEILNDSLENYLKKIAKSSRNRAAAYEVVIKSSHSFGAGQAVRYYITGTKKSVRIFENAKELSLYCQDNPDENTAYYIGKLEALLEQFPLLVPSADAGRQKSRS